jgi:hypothetical protein
MGYGPIGLNRGGMPQNVNCTAKAMEAIGSCGIVLRLYHSGDCVVLEYVSDDDSSTKNVLRHSYSDQLDKGLIDTFPRYENGKKTNDTGLLPIGHPAIKWLADRNHRIRGVSKKIFHLVNQKKDKYIGNNHDAERLKRCIAYAVRQNCLLDAEQMKTAILITVEHHFGNHEKCGTWCRVKLMVGEEREVSNLRYRNKDTPQGLKFYLDVKEIVAEFAEQSANMLHGWSSDIVEGMNRFFTKFLPKDRAYAMTIENQVRIHLAICIDSIGYEETYLRLAEATGLQLGSINQKLNRLLNDEKQYRRKYRKRSYVKINRRWKCFGKLRENSNKLVKENRKNLRYGPGIAGPFAEDRGTGDIGKSTTAVPRAVEGGKVEFKCPHCFLWGHQRKSSKLCLKNPGRPNSEPTCIPIITTTGT